jgi:hypothetical protein
VTRVVLTSNYVAKSLLLAHAAILGVVVAMASVKRVFHFFHIPMHKWQRLF